MPQKLAAKRRSAKDVLRLPDLDHSKTSVLQGLGSVASKRTYAFAINDFITWYCSEPRLAPVPARASLGGYNGEVSWLPSADRACSQRPAGLRAGSAPAEEVTRNQTLQAFLYV
jgi:hypothetical protein